MTEFFYNGYPVPTYTNGSTTTNTGIWTGSGTTSVYVPMTVSYPALEPAPAKPRTPLQWLDDEIKKTCALARAA